jgi:hypothetical protein
MNNKLKEILQYAGLVSACIGAIGYILIIWALVLGFENALTLNQMLLVAVIGAVDGILINIALRYQGITFAKREEISLAVNKRYQIIINRNKNIKEYRLIGWFMFWAIIRDIIFKGFTVGLSTYFIMYTFIEGNGDYSLFLIALSNILLFAGFGSMGLAGMYNKYLEEHIPALTGLCDKLDQVGSIPSEGAKKDVNVQQCELPKDASTSTKE